MSDQFELTVLNRKPELARVQDELEHFASRHAIPRRHLHEVQLALEEHLANIVNYAYLDELEHRIMVRFAFTGPELQIEVADDGRAFNPLEHPIPDLSVPLDQRPIGGLGILMMRKSLDGLAYRRENGRNILTMTKRL